MKRFSLRSRDIILCAVIVLTYFILFQVMTHTRMVEKMMALNFTWWELLLITGFIVSRLLTYLLIPSVIAAVLVHRLAAMAVDRRNRKA